MKKFRMLDSIVSIIQKVRVKKQKLYTKNNWIYIVINREKKCINTQLNAHMQQ